MYHATHVNLLGIEHEAQRWETSSKLLIYDSVAEFYYGTRTLLWWRTIVLKGMLSTQITMYENFDTIRDTPH